mgnify:CR=1 FL=1
MSDRKKAILLGALLLFLAAGCCIRIFLVSQQKVTLDRPLYADIYQNGDLLQSIRLDTVIGEYTFVIRGENGAANTVCVRPGSIAIVDASCPDQICVHQGFISTSLLPITCLPNRLVIRVREASDYGNPSTSVPDGVTY